eukprot:1315959-Amorphochlora_amoeboformis.AAC.1
MIPSGAKQIAVKARGKMMLGTGSGWWKVCEISSFGPINSTLGEDAGGQVIMMLPTSHLVDLVRRVPPTMMLSE